MKISPKVWIPTATAVLAGLALWAITDDKTALVVSLTGIAGGGIGAVAPPAPRVKQFEVAGLARKNRRRP